MINAQLIKALNSKKNNLYTDFRAEVVAVDLIKKGIDPLKIFIVPNGVIGKSSAKDVEVIRLQRSIYASDDYVYLITNRAGIYDTLPEGLFHEQYSYNQPDIKSKIKKTRAEEKKARQFFLPFEIIVNRYKTSIAYTEDVGLYENLNSIVNQFSFNWPIFKLLDQRQSVLFLYTIPVFHQIRNNFDCVSSFLSLLLGISITVVLKTKTASQRVYPELSLSESRLGVSSVLGGVLSETIYTIHVGIGPTSDEYLGSFVAKSKNDVLLDELFLWLFNCQIPIEKELVAINKSKQRPSTYYLGVNTFFN